MSEIATPPAHRLGAAVATARAALSAVAGERPWSMSSAQTAQALDEITALEAQTAELKSRVLTHAQAVDLPGEMGAPSVAGLLASRLRIRRPEAHRQARLASGLEAYQQLATAPRGCCERTFRLTLRD